MANGPTVRTGSHQWNQIRHDRIYEVPGLAIDQMMISWKGYSRKCKAGFELHKPPSTFSLATEALSPGRQVSSVEQAHRYVSQERRSPRSLLIVVIKSDVGDT